MSSCRRLADSRGLTATFVECGEDSRQYGHVAHLKEMPADTLTFAVYDVSLFSYADILRIFEQNSRKNVMIGTFNPKSHILITDQEVLR